MLEVSRTDHLMGRKLLNALVAFVAILVALLASELIVRVFKLAPEVVKIELNTPYATFEAVDNPILKYVPKPNAADINDYGIRDRNYTIEKREDTFRIVVLGDSIAFGFCTDENPLHLEATFPKVLERNLNRHTYAGFRDVEVINLAVSGYDTRQEIEFFEEKGIPLSPDLVLVAYHLNDKMDASVELNFFRMKSKGAHQIYRGLIFKSHLARFVRYRLPLVARRQTSADGRPLGEDRVSLGFQRLRGLSAQHGFETLVVVFPFFADFASYRMLDLHLEVNVKARKNGFHLLDLLDVFRRASNLDVQVLRDPCRGHHPNRLGHRIAAEAMESFILSQGLLPVAGAPDTSSVGSEALVQ